MNGWWFYDSIACLLPVGTWFCISWCGRSLKNEIRKGKSTEEKKTRETSAELSKIVTEGQSQRTENTRVARERARTLEKREAEEPREGTIGRRSLPDPEHLCMFLLGMPTSQGPDCPWPWPFLRLRLAEHSLQGWSNVSPPCWRCVGSLTALYKSGEFSKLSIPWLWCKLPMLMALLTPTCVTLVVPGRQERLTQPHRLSGYCSAAGKKILFLWHSSLVSFPSIHKSARGSFIRLKVG